MSGLPERRFVPILIGLAVLLGAPAFSQTIDFDDAGDGEVINSRYAGLGVSFLCINCEGGVTNVIARISQDFVPPSAPNVVATHDEISSQGCFSEDEEGIVRATFSPTVSTVSIRVLTDDTAGSDDIGYLRAYNSGNTQIDEAISSALTGPGTFEIISVSGDISYVEFAGLAGDDTCFDDLSFGAGVPTMPSSWMLILTGALALVGLYALKRRLSTA